MKIKFNLFVGILVFIFLTQYTKTINAETITDLQENDLVLGDLNAPITMIEYASLSCPHCADFHLNTLPEIKKDYIDTGKLKLIFRNFPLNLPALYASKITRCVDKELSFKYINALFTTQRSWVKSSGSKESLFEVVKNGGMTKEEFDSCLSDKNLEEDILNHQIKAQKKFKIQTTPSFIINSRLVSGNKSLETFITIFEDILSN